MVNERKNLGDCLGEVRGNRVFPLGAGPVTRTSSAEYEVREGRVYMRRVGKPDNVPVGRVVDGRAYLDRC